MSLTEYLEGAAFYLVTVAGSLATAAVIQRRLLPPLPAATAALAFGLLSSAAIALACFLPGVAGALSRTTTAGTALLLAAVAWRLVPRQRPRPSRDPPSPASPAWSWALAGVGVVAATVAGVAYLHARSLHPVTGIDALSFHLPTVARWIQLGTFWSQIGFQPDLSTGTYPHTGNLMALVSILPWRSTWIARYVDVPFLVMAAVGIYAFARELRAPAAPAVLAASALTSMAAVNRPALADAQVDPQMIAWFTAGLVFLLRFQRLGERRDLILAGIGLGLAFGTKWYSLPYVSVVIAVWVAAALVAGRPRGELARSATMLGGLVLLTGSFWLVRNWIEFGNPLHPAPVEILGITLFDAPPDRVREQAGWSIVHYLFDANVWGDYFLPAFRDTLGFVAPVALICLLVAGASAAATKDRRRPEAATALAVAAGSALIVAIYVSLPYSAFGPEGAPVLTMANTRYLVPALVGALALTAWLAGRAGRWRPAIEAVLLVAMLDSLRRAYWPEIGTVDVMRAGAAVVGLAALALLAWRRREQAKRPWVAAAALGSVALVATATGLWLERRWATHPYGEQDAAIGWLEANAASGQRVGLAGHWSAIGIPPILPAFGPRLGNEVSFIGEFVDGTLRRHRRRGPYEAALRREKYDLVLIGRGREWPPRGPGAVLDWTRAGGYAPVARSQRFILLRRHRSSSSARN